MISSKLRTLERQLAKGIPDAVPGADNSTLNKMLASVQEIADAKAQTAIDAAKAAQHKAETETADFRKQLAELNKELSQARKEALSKTEVASAVAKKEIDTLRHEYTVCMQKMQGEINALQDELVVECQAKVRAETALEGAEKMSVHLELMVSKLQAAKPVAAVVAPALVPDKPKEFKIRRDGLGNIDGLIVI